MNDQIKYHIISLPGVFKTKLFFTVDFEPVEIWMPEEYAFHLRNPNTKDDWQAIIDFTCKVLGKKKRHVECYREHNSLPRFNDTVLEFLHESHNGCFRYFITTKTHHIYKIYDENIFQNTIDKGSDKQSKEKQFCYFEKYQNHFKYLKKQGLGVGKNYFEPPFQLIEDLTKTVLKS